MAERGLADRHVEAAAAARPLRGAAQLADQLDAHGIGQCGQCGQEGDLVRIGVYGGAAVSAACRRVLHAALLGVAALTSGGAYAEVVVAEAATVFPLPKGVGLRAAAALPTVLPTAHALLHEVGRLRAGENVLVHGAAGGVGTVAGQLARAAGASAVYGVVSSATKAAIRARVRLRRGVRSACRCGVGVPLSLSSRPAVAAR